MKYVLEVAKQQNVTKAAENLHMTQPTLSKIIKNLEDELGVTLFDRSGKYVKLTDSGSAAMQQIRTIIQAVDDLYVKLEDVANLKTGTIKIGLPPVISSVFFPRIVASFQKHYPRIDFQIVEEGAKKVEQLIMDGHIDLGVVISPVDEACFEVMPFIEQRLALVIHKSHRLAGRETVSLSELREEPYIVFPRGFGVRDHIMKACHRVGFEPKIVYESSQWDLLAEMVAENLGISIMPEAICKKIASKEVLTLGLQDPVIPWHLIIIWRKEKYLSFAIRQFMKFAQAAAEEA